MSEKTQKQKEQSRQNFERLLSGDLWKDTITKEVRNLKSDSNRTNTKLNDIDEKVSILDRRLTSSERTSQRKTLRGKLVLFFWAFLVVPAGISFFVFGYFVGVQKSSNNQQSGQKISTPTQADQAQADQKETLNNSRESTREEPVSSPSPRVEKPTYKDPGQEESSPSTPEKPITSEAITPPPENSSNQPAFQPPEIKSQPEAPQPVIPKSIVRKWQGNFNQYNASHGTTITREDRYPMIMEIEKINGSYFTGKLKFPTLGNAITEIQGEFVTDTKDILEQIRWSYITEKLKKHELGSTWLKFTETKLLQGNGINPEFIVLNGWYYAHVRNDGSMVGLYFVDKRRSPNSAGDFLLDSASN